MYWVFLLLVLIVAGLAAIIMAFEEYARGETKAAASWWKAGALCVGVAVVILAASYWQHVKSSQRAPIQTEIVFTPSSTKAAYVVAKDLTLLGPCYPEGIRLDRTYGNDDWQVTFGRATMKARAANDYSVLIPQSWLRTRLGLATRKEQEDWLYYTFRSGKHIRFVMKEKPIPGTVPDWERPDSCFLDYLHLREEGK